jgi:hypothetical protein
MAEGEIVKFDDFSLYDAMAAVEVGSELPILLFRCSIVHFVGCVWQIMDPRVDTGMDVPGPSTTTGFTFDSRALLDPVEVLAIMDKLLTLEVRFCSTVTS